MVNIAFVKLSLVRMLSLIEIFQNHFRMNFFEFRYHQVNSIANKNSQNIAVNIWFKHDPNHLLKGCDIKEEEASINNFNFRGLDDFGEEDQNEDGEDRTTML